MKKDTQHLKAAHIHHTRHPALPRTGLALLLGALLAGCSFIPAYERPQAPVPAQLSSSLPSTLPVQADAIAAAEMGWRTFFRDPQLQSLIALALENNRDLRVAVLRVAEAQALYGVQASDQLPSVGAGAQGAITRQPQDMRAPGAGSFTRSYQAGVGITAFELDLFGRVRSLSEAAYQQYLASESSQRTVHIALVAQVAQAWFNLLATEHQLSLARSTLAARQQFFELVKLRFDNGIADALTLNQARTQLDSVRVELVQFERLQAQARNALQLVMGQELPAEVATRLSAPTAPALTVFDTNRTLANVPLQLPSSVLLQRPDIAAAEHQLLAANASIGAARAAFFPNISLTSTLGFASAALGDLFSVGSRGYWSFQPGITAPIFSGGGLRSNLQAAEVRKDISIAQYERAIQAAFREVADSLAGEATYANQLQALRALERSAAESLALAKLRYENGIDSFLQVQTAEIALFSTQQQLIQVSLASLVNRVELYKALGGGWMENTAALPSATDTADSAS